MTGESSKLSFDPIAVSEMYPLDISESFQKALGHRGVVTGILKIGDDPRLAGYMFVTASDMPFGESQMRQGHGLIHGRF